MQRAVRSGQQSEQQVAAEERLAQLEHYEDSPLFTQREKVALRYADAITWNPLAADDAMWAELHRHFSEPELVELGAFVGFIAGGQRWIHTLEVRHGELLFASTGGLSQQVAAELRASAVQDAGT